MMLIEEIPVAYFPQGFNSKGDEASLAALANMGRHGSSSCGLRQQSHGRLHSFSVIRLL